MASGGKLPNELLNNSLKLPKDLAHPQGARVPNVAVIELDLETTVSCCRPISTPQILPVLLLPLFPGWDLQIFQGVFLIMSSSPKGEKGRCVSVGTPYFHNFAPASPPSPPPPPPPPPPPSFYLSLPKTLLSGPILRSSLTIFFFTACCTP